MNPTPFSLELIHAPEHNASLPWVVSISIEGSFWDARFFASESDAKAFIEDPFADDRHRNIELDRRNAARVAQQDRYITGELMPRNRGRHVRRGH